MKKITNGFREIICEHYFERRMKDGYIYLYCCEVYFNHQKNDIYVNIYLQVAPDIWCYWGTRKVYYTKTNEYICYKGKRIKLGWL